MIRIPEHTPAFETRRGQVYEGDALEILRAVPDDSVNLVITSPPYALEFKKEYGNESQADYVDWFLPFAREVRRVLTDDGSFVVNIGGAWQKGHPVRSLYHFRLLIALRFGRPAVSTKFTNSPSPCSMDATKRNSPSASSRARTSPDSSKARKYSTAARAASSTLAMPSRPSRCGEPVGR